MPFDFFKKIGNSCSLFIEKKNGAQNTQSAPISTYNFNF